MKTRIRNVLDWVNFPNASVGMHFPSITILFSVRSKIQPAKSVSANDLCLCHRGLNSAACIGLSEEKILTLMHGEPLVSI
jgi:hypothetical protein